MTNKLLNEMTEISKQTYITSSMDKFLFKYYQLLNATMNQK